MPSYEVFFTLIRNTDINKLFVAACFLFPEGKIDLVCYAMD